MRAMTQGEDPFQLFLSLLSPDPDEAEKRFKDIRRRQILLFDLRGCTASEDIVDEAILCFVRHLAARTQPFEGNPVAYLYTVAHHLHLDYIDNPPLPLPNDISELPQPEADVEEERLHDCLDGCLNEMDAKDRELLLDYYRLEKQAKIDFRKELARRIGISVNALRIKVYHLRNALEACIEECLGLKSRAEME